MDRAYRKGRTPAQAMKIIRDASGSQFDPRVVAVFMELYEIPEAPTGDEQRVA